MNAPTLEQRLATRLPGNDSWIMQQTWANLLFLHWRIPAEAVQRTLPPGLTVDTYDGSAWVGVVPFFMKGVRPRGLPAVGGLSDFLELNVRTYVFDGAGQPGVWFYSLDCNQRVAVTLARKFFHLPYEHARMTTVFAKDALYYTSCRRGCDDEARYVYQRAKLGQIAAPGSLEFFLVERYLLFAYASGVARLFSGRVSHTPYKVVPQSASVWSDVPLQQAGFAVNGRVPDHQCTAEPINVRVYRLNEVQRVASDH
jgi:uncharacterized protein YqjF (DUF2071 family)